MPQGGVQQLCQKLNKHWTNIAHHLYLKHECPVPLPAVGPLAELLSVTRKVATDINALVLSDSLTPSCVSTLTKERCVKLLGKLIGWLQQQPHEQLLLNTEQQESLWQLLLITLANMLRVVAHDSEHASAFLQQLQESGMVPSLSSALHWLLQHYPRRCLTASAGAWLLLQELLTSSDTVSRSSSIAGAVDSKGSSSSSSSSAAGAELAGCLQQLGPVLQGYIDQAYHTHRRPAGGRLSGSGSAKKHNKEGSSSTGGAEQPQSSSSSSTDVVAAIAAVEDGSWACTHPVCLTDDPSSALFRNLLALLHVLQAHMLDIPLTAAAATQIACADIADPQQQQQQQPVPVLPAKAYLQILAVGNMWLHDNAAAATGSSDNATISAASIPADHLQVLPLKAVAAAAACLLGISSSAAALHSISRACEALQGGLFDLTVVPSAATTLDSDAAAAAETLDDQAEAAAAAAAAETLESTNAVAAADGQAASTAEGDVSGNASEEPVTPTVGDAAAAAANAGLTWDIVDSVLGFKLLLEAVALLQLHGQSTYLALPLQQLAASARGCSRQEMQQLIATRGQLLLQILSEYLMHAPVGTPKQQQQQQQQLDSEEFEQQQQQMEGSSDNAERCVLCAHVLIQMCPGRLAGASGALGSHGLVDDQLLGALTEQDPARFYAIMDHLVRHVQPQNLQVLLPMSASFLTRSLHTEEQSGEQPGSSSSSSIVPAVAADDADAAATAGSLLKGGSYTARTKKSMVILSDYAVCRSFAAALHGYSKSVLGPVLSQQQEGGMQQSSSSGEQVQQQQEHETPVHYVLPPLQKVAEWLAVGLEDAIITALQGQEDDTATAGQGDSNGKPKSPKKKAGKQQQQLSPHDIAAQVQSASQAAACGLVLVTLLARAAVPVLQELQQALQQLPAAKLSADYRGAVIGDASVGDAVIAELGAIDLLSGLMFVRAAYQALCARCYLTQVLNGLPARLFQNGKAAAGTSAAAEDAAALNAVKAALRGDGLARGWAHLVQPVPPAVTVRVRGFQEKHPGDFVASLSLLQRLVPVDVVAVDAAMQQQVQGSSAAIGGDAAVEAEPQLAVLKLPGQLKSQLTALLDDLLHLFGSLLSEVPLPVGCNNPACTNLEGVAEASLSVNKRCKNCLSAHYCSKQCQTEHWTSHKAACSRVKSMTAG